MDIIYFRVIVSVIHSLQQFSRYQDIHMLPARVCAIEETRTFGKCATYADHASWLNIHFVKTHPNLHPHPHLYTTRIQYSLIMRKHSTAPCIQKLDAVNQYHCCTLQSASLLPTYGGTAPPPPPPPADDLGEEQHDRLLRNTSCPFSSSSPRHRVSCRLLSRRPMPQERTIYHPDIMLE